MKENKVEVVYKKVDEIIPYINNPRHNEAAIDKVAASIKEFGFKVPIVIDRDNVIVTGHTRREAALKLNLEEIPCIYADDLTPAQVKAFRLADNKTAEFSNWDFLKLEQELFDIDESIDMVLFGFREDDAPLDLSQFDTDIEVTPKEPKKTVCPNCGREF